MFFLERQRVKTQLTIKEMLDDVVVVTEIFRDHADNARHIRCLNHVNNHSVRPIYTRLASVTGAWTLQLLQLIAGPSFWHIY